MRTPGARGIGAGESESMGRKRRIRLAVGSALTAAWSAAAPSAEAQAQAVPCSLLPTAERPRLVPDGQDPRRALELLGEERGYWLIRRGADPRWARPESCAGGARPAVLSYTPAAMALVNNSAYPRPDRDGALWAGRGASGAATAGAALRWGAFSAAFQPLVAWQQNADFDFVASEAPQFSRFHYAWHPAIDWPTRFGGGGFVTLSPGQSYARLDVSAGALGVSSENLWWGPALRNPLLMSSAADGFPHAFARLNPLGIGIGTLELELVWGLLRESDYFDRTPDNDRRYYAGQVAVFRPALLRGLELGFARSYLATVPGNRFDLGDFLLESFRDVSVNLDENQLVSLFGRVAPPGSGFEAFAEWGREDWWSTFGDLIKEPDHSQAYTVGAQQVVLTGAGAFRLYGEVTHLGASTATVRSGRGVSTFYTHSGVRQGYTHRGQMLGAPIGPGSDAQALAGELVGAGWTAGLLLERVRYDNDAYYQRWVDLHDFRGHDVELTAEASGGVRVGLVDLWGSLGYSRRTSRNFLRLEDRSGNFLIEGNWRLTLGAGWRP